MPRFVLLEHDYPQLHCDMMLQAGEALWTWRLDAPPAGEAVRAERIADHRILYLDYEGPISGNRGSVRRWDHGEFTWLLQEDDLIEVALQGERLRGRLRLRRLEGDCWQAAYRPGPP
jgi:hypothetical protein